MISFTSDQHYDHDRICELTNRPFKNTSVMNKVLIRNYNEIVSDDDECFMLGDLSLRTESHKDILKNIVSSHRGTKTLILGNHDSLKPFSYIDIGFQSVHTSLILKNLSTGIPELDEICTKLTFILHHDPCASCLNRLPGTIWLCGHIHDLFKVCGNVINVGVDVWDYKPVTLVQIMQLIIDSGIHKYGID